MAPPASVGFAFTLCFFQVGCWSCLWSKMQRTVFLSSREVGVTSSELGAPLGASLHCAQGWLGQFTVSTCPAGQLVVL